MSQSVQICRALPIADPKPSLSCSLKAGIVAFALGTQGIGSLEAQALPVYGEPVIGGNRLVFGASPVFLPIVPVFVVAGANPGSGLVDSGQLLSVCFCSNLILPFSSSAFYTK